MADKAILKNGEISAQAYTEPTWRGVGWPLHDNGMLSFVIDEHAINSSLRILLQTEPGERIMENDFGTPLRDLLFEQPYPGLEEDAAMRVANSIATWERRIVILPPGIETNIVEESNISSTGASAMGIRFVYAMKSNVSVRHTFEMFIYRKVTASDGLGDNLQQAESLDRNPGEQVRSFNA